MRILLVEDERDIAETIGDFLELKNHVVEFAFDGRMAMNIMRDTEFDVVVMDIMMPGIDGLETCRALRAAGDTTPILMLTARDTLDDKLTGYQSGADDYLVKPFAMEELLARLLALNTRGKRQDVGRVVIGDLELNLHERRATRDGRVLALNRTQFELLKALAIVSPAVVSRASLVHQIWGDDLPDSDALRTHVYRLRNIVDKPFDKPLLHTVHGTGFRLESE